MFITNFKTLSGEENIYLEAAKKSGQNIWIQDNAVDCLGRPLKSHKSLHSSGSDLSGFWREVRKIQKSFNCRIGKQYQSGDHHFISRDGEVWYRWNGGDGSKMGTVVVAFRYGKIDDYPIKWYACWWNDNDDGDIIAYRPIKGES